MRLAGVTRGARGLGPSGPLCWIYDDRPDFTGRVLEFMADGIALGQRVRYTAAGALDRLLAELAGLDGLQDWVKKGAVQVRSLDQVYPDGPPVDELAQMQTHAEEADQARADGFTGLRVAADATPLVRTPAQLEAFLRYEHLMDRYLAGQPFAALCAYDRRELGPELTTQIACMHPNANEGATQFRLHASSWAAAALGGEVDINVRRLLALALERAGLRPTNGELVIDAAELTFIDHRSLIMLGQFAAARGAVAVLRTANPNPARIVDVLELQDVRVEPPR